MNFLRRIFGANFACIRRLATVGCRLPRHLKQIVYCQVLVAALFLFLWLKWNGGLLPWFLWPSPPQPVKPDINILKFFPNAMGDGAKIIWKHRVNSMERLINALNSNSMMLEGDLVLRGQGSDKQQLIPIMAHPPDTDSDLTFQMMLDIVHNRDKGLKLDFKTIDAVDISLEKLRVFSPKLRIPIFLNADVLMGPGSERSASKPLDGPRFIKLVKTHFPQSTLSLGWITYWSQEKKTPHGYTWTHVWDMMRLIEEMDVEQPITFAVRAVHLKHSLQKIRWLCDMMGATISVWAPPSDDIPQETILQLRHFFPQANVYYDIPPKNLAIFDAKEPLPTLAKDLEQIEEYVYKPSQWMVMRSPLARNDDRAYMGSSAGIVLSDKIMFVSAQGYQPSHEKPLTFEGGVQFVDPEPGLKQGVDIILRSNSHEDPNMMSGIVVNIGANGAVSIGTFNKPDDKSEPKQATIKPSPTSCFRFTITDDSKTVSISVTTLIECESPRETSKDTLNLSYEASQITRSFHFVAFRLSGDNTKAAVHTLMLL